MSFKLTWLGHAALSLETGGKKLLVDPFLDGNPAATVSPDQVEADYILLSHGHSDHVGDTIEIAKRTGATVISNAEIYEWLYKKGFENLREQHIGGGHNYPFGYLKFTNAVHGSGLPDGSDGGNPVGFLLTTLDRQKVYIACDTGLFGDMRLIGEEGIDLAVLPIGDNYTMGPDDALRAVKFLQPRHVIPYHYNTFEVIRQDAGAWSMRVTSETETQVHVLQPGDSFELS